MGTYVQEIFIQIIIYCQDLKLHYLSCYDKNITIFTNYFEFVKIALTNHIFKIITDKEQGAIHMSVRWRHRVVQKYG